MSGSFVTGRAVDVAVAAPKKRRRLGRPGGRWWAWVVFIIGITYFVVPLIATLEFSLRPNLRPGPTRIVLQDPRFYRGLGYSFIIGLITIVLSLGLIIPTAYWVRLRLPRLRPVVEFVTLLPFVLPPIVLAYGLIRLLQPSAVRRHRDRSRQFRRCSSPRTSCCRCRTCTARWTTASRRWTCGCMTEAAQSLGAGWFRILWSVIFPNLRTAALSGAFLTLAIVVGEFTIASALARPAFGPYLSLLGKDKIYEPAAVSLISFGLTWLAMIFLALVARGSRTRVQLGGAR